MKLVTSFYSKFYFLFRNKIYCIRGAEKEKCLEHLGGKSWGNCLGLERGGLKCRNYKRRSLNVGWTKDCTKLGSKTRGSKTLRRVKNWVGW